MHSAAAAAKGSGAAASTATVHEHPADLLGDEHVATSISTPLRPDAFVLSDEEKITAIEPLFGQVRPTRPRPTPHTLLTDRLRRRRQIMDVLGLDRSDDSLAGTPHRVAKMYVSEIFRGLNPANQPVCRSFENAYRYGEMLIERDISLNSTCEHHFLPIVGKAHVAYFCSGRVVGLSKLNRVVDYFARRPQVQERLTRQISEALQLELGTEDVAVIIDAKHHCVSSRGVGDESSSTVTADYCGAFRKPETRQELLQLIHAGRA